VAAGRRGGARALVVRAVLAGLFLMHGAPAGASGGCHGEPVVAVTVHGEHHESAPAMSGTAAGTGAGPTAAAVGTGAAARTAVVTGGGPHEGLCVSTPARGHVPLPVPALLGTAALTALAAWSVLLAWRLAAMRRRGPPTGRRLLLQVCVART
jgi:hypothetical protein